MGSLNRVTIPTRCLNHIPLYPHSIATIKSPDIPDIIEHLHILLLLLPLVEGQLEDTFLGEGGPEALHTAPQNPDTPWLEEQDTQSGDCARDQQLRSCEYLRGGNLKMSREQELLKTSNFTLYI